MGALAAKAALRAERDALLEQVEALKLGRGTEVSDACYMCAPIKARDSQYREYETAEGRTVGVIHVAK